MVSSNLLLISWGKRPLLHPLILPVDSLTKGAAPQITRRNKWKERRREEEIEKTARWLTDREACQGRRLKLTWHPNPSRNAACGGCAHKFCFEVPSTPSLLKCVWMIQRTYSSTLAICTHSIFRLVSYRSLMEKANERLGQSIWASFSFSGWKPAESRPLPPSKPTRPTLLRASVCLLLGGREQLVYGG